MRTLQGILLLAVTASFLTVGPAMADVELVLKNGTVLPGLDVENRRGTYVVRLHNGQTVEVPVKLVESLRLSGSGRPQEGDSDKTSAETLPPAVPRAGLRVGEPATLAGQEVQPPDIENEAGVRRRSPGTVAGQQVEGPETPAYPDRGEGEAPRAGVIPSSPATVSDPQSRRNGPPSGVWVPRDDWGESDWPRADDSGRPEWNGADSATWTPENALERDDSNFNPSQWMKTPDSSWTPTDGFRKQNTSFSTGAPAARALRTSTRVSGTARLDASPAEAPPRPVLGVASWYGAEHDGDNTASGRRFDMQDFTAASPDLPFGSLVLVTNLDNRKNILVEITDRVSSDTGRAINLSHAAAARLDMVDRGLAPVRMEVVPGVDPAAMPTTPPSGG